MSVNGVRFQVLESAKNNNFLKAKEDVKGLLGLDKDLAYGAISVCFVLNSVKSSSEEAM